MLSTSHVQRTRRTDRSGLGQSRGATLENERSPAASRQSRQPRVAQSRSCSRDACLARGVWRARVVDLLTSDFSPVRLSARGDHVPRITCAERRLTQRREHSSVHSCGTSSMRDRSRSLVVATRIRILQDPPRVPLIRA